MLGWLWLTVALAGFADAVPQSPKHVVHESRAVQPNGWVKRSRIAAGSILPVRIGLTQTNLDKIHDMLMDLSHPGSPNYGKWMSPEDVHEFFIPNAETVNAVREWLVSEGIAKDRIIHSDNKGWIALDATAKEAEMLFQTTFHEYEHRTLEGLMVGTDSYSVPQHLAPHIDYIKPGAALVAAKRRSVKRNGHARQADFRHRRSVTSWLDGTLSRTNEPPNKDSLQNKLDPSLAGCWLDFTVLCLRALYGMPEPPQTVDDANALGIYAEGSYFDQSDLDKTYWSFANWVPNGTQPIPALINGAQYNVGGNLTEEMIQEAITDLSIATSIIYPQEVVLYQTDDPLQAERFLTDTPYGTQNTFLDALDGSYCTYSAYGETGNSAIDPQYPNPDPAGYKGQLMCGVYKPTKVISISYTSNEHELPPSYQKRQCLEFAKLGLMGTSILVATGDDGLGRPTFVNNSTLEVCLGPKGAIFNPQSSVNCPYVTAVGATMIYANQTVEDAESVLDFRFPHNLGNLTSGAGFSNIFARPEYQDKAVQHYLDNFDPGYPFYEEFSPDLSKVQGWYNRIGRAYPDVSAYGFNWDMYIAGDAWGISGTSASTPVFASIVTLLNEERSRIGKDSIGFMNPVLYAHPEIFNDIVNGSAIGCGTEGFPARPGWDLSSGLGTPIYPKMKDLWLSI